MNIFDQLTGLIAPHECLGCGAEATLLCDSCGQKVPKLPSRCYVCHKLTEDYRTCDACRRHSPLYQVIAFCNYEGTPKELVHILKFGRAQAAAKDVAAMLSRLLTPGSNIVITYAPTTGKRVRQRGYDQAKLIAKTLADKNNLTYGRALSRKGVSRQVGQNRNVRKEQMKYAFDCTNVKLIKNKHVLLVDDVLTTGATCESAATVMLAAGARRVSVIVFAVV